MSRTRLFCALIFPVLVGMSISKAEIPIVFHIIDSTRTESISYSTGNTSTQQISHHGTMSAVLSFDPISQMPTAIRFTDGLIYQSDSNFKNTADINIPFVGTKRVVVERISTGLQLKVHTIGLAHTVSTSGKILDTQRLQSLPIAGKLTAKLTLDGRTQTQSIDVATNPPDNVEPTVGTDIYLEVFEIANHGTTSDYKITFSASISAKSTEFMPGSSIVSTTDGSSFAEAHFSAPSKYGQWLHNYGYTADDLYAFGPQGIPLAVLFAFNLPANQTSRLPWRFTSESKTPVITLQLPATGLERGIRIESRNNLKTGDWELLNNDHFLTGEAILNSRSSGTIRIRFPNTKSRFYRIMPETSASE